MKRESKTDYEQRYQHYRVEKSLASRLRGASRAERRKMYGQVYDELYGIVRYHPLVKRKAMRFDEACKSRGIRTQVRFINRFLNTKCVFMEIGAGSGQVAVQIAGHVQRVIALDVSREISCRDDLPANMEVIIFDGVEVPIEIADVDVAYSHQTIEHIHPDDAEIQIRTVLRTLRRNGVYVCVAPNRLTGPHDISRGFDKVSTGFHLKEYTTTELRAMCLSAGFSKTRSYIGASGLYIWTPLFVLRTIERLIEWLPAFLRDIVVKWKVLRTLLEIRMCAWKC